MMGDQHYETHEGKEGSSRQVKKHKITFALATMKLSSHEKQG